MAKICWRSLPRLAYIDGDTLYHRSFIVRNANPRKIFPWQAWYLGKIFFTSRWIRLSTFKYDLPNHSVKTIFDFYFQFHSHQIFHCFVIAGAFVHYHGISLMALYRLQKGDCPMEPVNEQCIIDSIHNSHMIANHTN